MVNKLTTRAIPESGSIEDLFNVINHLKKQNEHNKLLNLTREGLHKFPNNDLLFVEFCLALEENKMASEAIDSLRSGLKLNQESNPISGTLIGMLFRTRRYAEMKIEINKYIEKLRKKNINNANIHNIVTTLTSICLHSMYMDDFSDNDRWAIHSKFGQIMSKNMIKIYGMDNAKKIKSIGFVSNQLYKNHPVGRFSTKLIRELSANGYMIYIYHNTLRDHNSFVAVEEEFINTNVTIRKISSDNPVGSAQIVRADKVNLLIDLAGCTEGNALAMFACRPAPIQASWIGYPGHPGIKEIDFFLSDNFCSPFNGLHPKEMTKKIYRFKRFFTCYEAPHVNGGDTPPIESNGIVSFGSFNNIDKISKETIRVWSAVLNATPNSILALKFFKKTEHQLEEIKKLFSILGVDDSRIKIMPKSSSLAETLLSYDEIDIALDTFPYNGMTTTCDALWMGVPVITHYGTSHVSCASSSILQSIGAPELIAEDWDSFVEKTKNLASDIKRLKFYKKNLRRMMLRSEVCDEKDMAIHFGDFVSSLEIKK